MENCARQNCNRELANNDKCIMLLDFRGRIGTVEEINKTGGRQFSLRFSFLSKFCPECAIKEIEERLPRE